jgi:hypothetical protein
MYLTFSEVIPLSLLDHDHSNRYGVHQGRAALFLGRLSRLTLEDWKSVVARNMALGEARQRGEHPPVPNAMFDSIRGQLMSEGVESGIRRVADDSGTIVLRHVPKPAEAGIRGSQGWALSVVPILAAGLLTDWANKPEFATLYAPFDEVIPMASVL